MNNFQKVFKAKIVIENHADDEEPLFEKVKLPSLNELTNSNTEEG